MGDVARPWYMHPHQDDNLVVLHGKIKSFEVTPNKIVENGVVICEGPAMLVWPHGVFHRIKSPDEGSSAIILLCTTKR